MRILDFRKWTRIHVPKGRGIGENVRDEVVSREHFAFIANNICRLIMGSVNKFKVSH